MPRNLEDALVPDAVRRILLSPLPQGRFPGTVGVPPAVFTARKSPHTEEISQKNSENLSTGQVTGASLPVIVVLSGGITRRSFLDRLRRAPRKRMALVAFLVVGLLALVATLPAVAGTTFTVTNTDDAGSGSLRRAILDANNVPNGVMGADAIRFDIPGGGVRKISPNSSLPKITAPVVIDGYTQPGASENTLAQGNDANLLIELDGSRLPDGVRIYDDGFVDVPTGLRTYGGGSTVRGLVINRFQYYGIDMGNAGTATEMRKVGNTYATCCKRANRQLPVSNH